MNAYLFSSILQCEDTRNQFYTIVRTGKGDHAPFNNYTILRDHVEELTHPKSKSTCMKMFCTVVPLQVLFNIKTPRTQLYTIVKTGKGEHAQFNNYTTLQEHLEEMTHMKISSSAI